MKRILLLSFFLLSLTQLQAQKSGLGVVPLWTNQAQSTQFHQWQQHRMMSKKALDTMQLPFFDDFSYIARYLWDPSYHGIYPYDTLWLDHEVFVNTTMTDSAPSVGVATFDGLNQEGRPYDPFAIRASSNPCDTLTSRPIDLSGIAKGDTTVYFSFYCQPWGLGVAPKEQDTFLLEFLYPVVDSNGIPVIDTSTKKQAMAWKHVWASTGVLKGVTVSPPFQFVILPVRDTFFYKGFQFRFRNYGNRSGNLDHWHLDYVWLDRARKRDTLVNDIAIQKLPTPLLANFSLMPSKHLLNAKNGGFIANITANIYNTVRNNGTDSNSINATWYNTVKSIYDTNGAAAIYPFSSFLNSQNILPLRTKLFKDSLVKTNGSNNIKLINNLSLDTLSFLTIDSIKAPKSGNLFPQNDKVYRMMQLTNLYAYDDGSAEAGLGLINTQSGQVALEFDPIQSDVLQGILIHFNESEQDISSYLWSLVVWQSIDLVNPPGQTNDKILWRLDNYHSTYLNWYNDYIYIPLDTLLPVGTTFFIGWIQNNDFVLNVGLDRNYDEISQYQANPHLYFNIDGSWKQNTEIHGAPMIRAVMGSTPYTGIEPIVKQKSGNISVFPNPSNGSFTLKLPDQILATAALYQMNGNLIQTRSGLSGKANLDFTGISPGMYLLKVSSNKEVWWEKIIIK